MLKRNFVLVALISLFAAIPAFSQGPPPNDVRDLVGARASGGETQLSRRGYRYIKGSKSNNRSYSSWWKSSTRTCIMVATYNGRYDSIVTTGAFDCNQNNGGGNTGNPDIKGVKVYEDRNYRGRSQDFGVGRYLNIARQLGNLLNDTASSVVVQQGFNVRICDSEGGFNGNGTGRCEEYGAGSHNLRYDNTASYIEVRWVGGFNSGSNKVQTNDLIGMRGAAGESQLESRGFRNVDGYKTNNASITIWWRPQSSQCIQVTTANGQYRSITDLFSHPKCR